ncbi:MAG: putative baseplate assembly protein [Anaerolineae bacterium]
MSNATDLSTCKCCETTIETPSHTNRPGQSALAYRIGTHSTFLRRMVARLATQEIPTGENAGARPLADLTTRSTEDPAIALLDAWATVGDVLTFYQERIANDGYLRTATERRSVLELARAIGYELSPGVAASTYLAFTVDDAESSSDTATIESGTQVQSIPAAQGELPQTFETSEEFEARVEWNELKPVTTEEHVIEVETKELCLAGVNTQLQTGDAILIVGDERNRWPGSERWDFRIVDTVTAYPEEDYTVVTWKTGLGHEKPPVEPADNPRIFAFRQRARLFGYNAPDWRAMSEDIKTAYDPDYDPSDRRRTQWPDFEIRTTAERRIDLDVTYPKIKVDSWVALVKPSYVELYKVVEAVTDSRTDFTLTAQVTRLEFDTREHLSWFGLRDTVVYAESEELTRADKPLTTAVTGNTIQLDGLVEGLQKDQALVVSGKLNADDEDTVSEVVFVESATPNEKTTTLVLQDGGLQNSYVRSTVIIYANVVQATHGETVTEEVLGSGDGAQTHQQFTLKKSPLTYVSAATASGAKSTLELRVNRVLWEEVSSLYGKEATDQNYIVRIDNDAKATMIFGDGKSGARLPTGQENVKTTYRAGIGSGGEVDAGSLTLLKTRPFGVRGVTNPLTASGAADPEKLENARTNAPLTVLTLDRIVSLRDFEDFARAFSGIGKAQAVNLWNGETYLVHITIADDNGDEVAATSTTYENLSDAINAARDPTAEVLIDSFEPLAFNLKASVLYDASYLADDVRAKIEDALLAAFSFGQRSFGQPVTAAEIISVIHQVAGVVAVDLDELAIVSDGLQVAERVRTFTQVKPASVLPAQSARRENGDILPAQLLLINESGIDLTMKSAADQTSLK